MDIEKDKSEEEIKNTVLERGVFKANGYEFIVKPVFLGEEDDYLSDVPYFLYPKLKDGNEPSEKDLSHYAISIFKPGNNTDKEKINLITKIKRWFAKKYTHTYEYYSDNPSVLGLVKWIENKVYYKGRKVKFYDLERKFGLNKSEIVKLFGYFQDLSGF